MPATLTLTGFDEFMAALTRLAPDFTSAAGQLEATHANDGRQALRAAVPVDTGRLATASGSRRAPPVAPASVPRSSSACPTPATWNSARATCRPARRLSPSPAAPARRSCTAVIDRVKAEGLKVTGG